MKLQELFKLSAIAMAAGVMLVGCQASVDPGAGGGVNDNGTGNIVSEGDDGSGNSTVTGDPLFPNDGTVTAGTVVTDDGTGTGTYTPVAGTDPATGTATGKSFICTDSARSPLATSEATADGLVGGPLSDLLNGLGGSTATNLLNSVIDQDLTLDGLLSTGSTFSLTLDLLGLVSSVGQTITLSQSLPSGSYAVFALEFPAATLEASLIDTVSVTTRLGDVVQETVSYTQNAVVDLLGTGASGDAIALLGLKTSKPWNNATVALQPGLLSVDVGEAMKAMELCTAGKVIDTPVAQ